MRVDVASSSEFLHLVEVDDQGNANVDAEVVCEQGGELVEALETVALASQDRRRVDHMHREYLLGERLDRAHDVAERVDVDPFEDAVLTQGLRKAPRDRPSTSSFATAAAKASQVTPIGVSGPLSGQNR